MFPLTIKDYIKDKIKFHQYFQLSIIYLGTYTIPDVNGDPIVVKYRAGPQTGFVIENFDEVQSRTDPASAQTAPVHQDSSLTASIVVPEPIIS